MDMGVPLHDKRVTALIANRMKRFSFSDHIYLIAGTPSHQVPSQRPALITGGGGSFSDGPYQDKSQ
ncbi:hypothetical protein IC575_013634 [Cucumis melo]